MYYAPHVGFFLFSIAGMLLFWGGVIVLVIWAVRSFTNRPLPVAPAPPTPRQILDERLARGDVSVADYEKARAALEKPDKPS